MYTTNTLHSSKLANSYPVLIYRSRGLSGVAIITLKRVRNKIISLFIHTITINTNDVMEVGAQLPVVMGNFYNYWGSKTLYTKNTRLVNVRILKYLHMI